MAKKECIPFMALAVASISFLGFLACGFVCLTLDKALKRQRNEWSDTQAQLIAFQDALRTQRRQLGETREQLAAANRHIAEAQKANQARSQSAAEIQAMPRESKVATEAALPLVHLPVPAPDVPAPDSVEGKLLAGGKAWERADGQPIAGGYVLDILQGRQGQPKGRGRLGMVLSMAANPEGRPVATVDFGHGYVVGISAAELAPVRLLGPDFR